MILMRSSGRPGLLPRTLSRYRRYSLFLFVLLLLTPSTGMSQQRPQLALSVLQFGTAHWELDHIQRQGLDVEAGYDLHVRLVANLSASRLAVSAGDVNGAVADLMWAQARYEGDDPYLYLPFSSQIGDILVANDSPIESIADFRGKRIGVAGGPDSKGWILLKRVAADGGVNLETEATVKYGAPPLLSEALRRDQVDVLVTYWHFAAKLRGTGAARTALQMADLLDQLGLDRDLPVLGYVFRQSWVKDNPALLERFARSLVRAKAQLAQTPAHWEAIRPLMRAEDDGAFAALRTGFVAGTPAPLDSQRIADLQRLLTLTGTSGDEVMPASLFYRTGARPEP